MSCSEPSSPEGEDEDEESDRILGLWFEETLAPPENVTDTQTNQTNEENQDNAAKTTARVGIIVPEKGEPHGVNFSLLMILKFLSFLSFSLSNFVSVYFSSYSDFSIYEQTFLKQ